MSNLHALTLFKKTAVETTMTQKQLYEISSPLWARHEPLYRLHDFLYRINNGEITIDEYLNEKK